MHRLLTISAFAVLASLVWGIYLLKSNVAPPASVTDPDLSCGSAVGAARGQPTYGGELPYPDDWIDLCEDAAKDRLRWVVAPAVTGSLSLLCLTGAFFVSKRLARVESGPVGTKAV